MLPSAVLRRAAPWSGRRRCKCPPWLAPGGGRAASKLTTSDVFVPATFSRVEAADHAPLISAYTTNGFVIRGARVLGAVALLPRGYLHWRVDDHAQLTPESFTLFHLVQPELDLLVLGTGTHVQRIPADITALLQRRGIALEVQDTPNACATFNFLLGEGRPAGAALIPPNYIPP